MRSGPTKILSVKAALFVLLAFQLIVGLPLQTALAAFDAPAAMQAKTIAGARLLAPAAMMTTPAPNGTRLTDGPMPMRAVHSSTPTATATATADCPMHDAAHGATPAGSRNKHAPTGNHDCCHVSACQCQCVYTPALFDLPPFADVATSVALPSLSSAQFVAPRVDEFLRPPIA